jgi:hypothetical protein
LESEGHAIERVNIFLKAKQDCRLNNCGRTGVCVEGDSERCSESLEDATVNLSQLRSQIPPVGGEAWTGEASKRWSRGPR